MCVSITTIIKFYYKKKKYRCVNLALSLSLSLSLSLYVHEAVMGNNQRKPSSLYPSQVVLTIFGLVKV